MEPHTPSALQPPLGQGDWFTGSSAHICGFADSQLTLEAVYSLLGMVSLCHASILDEPPVGTPQASPRIPWVFWLGAVQQVPALGTHPRSC